MKIQIILTAVCIGFAATSIAQQNSRPAVRYFHGKLYSFTPKSNCLPVSVNHFPCSCYHFGTPYFPTQRLKDRILD